MNKKLQDLKNQMDEKWKTAESRLLESNSFNSMREKYQSLNRGRQKLIKFLALFFILSALAYAPVSHFISSALSWREFKEKQNLSLEMLKMRNKISSFVFRDSQAQLKNKIRRIVRKYSADNFQIQGERKPFPKEPFIDQADFNVQVDHLNIKQAIRLGTELHSLTQARLSAITMEESQKFQKHYDVVYKISAFVLKDQRGASSKRKRLSRRRRKALSPKPEPPAKGLKDFSKRGAKHQRKRDKKDISLEPSFETKIQKGEQGKVRPEEKR